MRTILNNARPTRGPRRAAARFMFLGLAAAGFALAACGQGGGADGAGEVNLYSARHYDADEQLYGLFEEKTGIRVNRIEMKGDLLLERLKTEGDKSPADVVLLVDAGNFWRAEQAGLLGKLQSRPLETAIPAHLRHPEGRWFGFATRARVIAYDRRTIRPEQVDTYDDLADPALAGKVCVRPSSNVYNLSLMADLIHRSGGERALAWARGVVANFARPPEGSDTDQIKAIAEGRCQVAVVNHYYAVRLQRSDKAEERALVAHVALSFPDQAGAGTHVNISGAGPAAHAPNPDNARRFLEFLASPEAQAILASANNEFPVVAGVAAGSPELTALAAFKTAQTPMAVLGRNQAEAQKLLDQAGWK